MHAFHSKGYIVPDKHKQQFNDKNNGNDENRIEEEIED